MIPALVHLSLKAFLLVTEAACQSTLHTQGYRTSIMFMTASQTANKGCLHSCKPKMGLNFTGPVGLAQDLYKTKATGLTLLK